MTPRKTRALLIAPLLAGCPLAASERGAADSAYDRHVVFDQSARALAYYGSEGTVTAPSSLELLGGRIPLDAGHFVVPSNSLRLTWKSATGGDWQAILKSHLQYGVTNNFDGDTLTLWCLSETGLRPEEAPRIHLEDRSEAGTFTINLLAGHGARRPVGAASSSAFGLPRDLPRHGRQRLQASEPL
jgi:hypothetical protein